MMSKNLNASSGLGNKTLIFCWIATRRCSSPVTGLASSENLYFIRSFFDGPSVFR